MTILLFSAKWSFKTKSNLTVMEDNPFLLVASVCRKDTYIVTRVAKIAIKIVIVRHQFLIGLCVLQKSVKIFAKGGCNETT